MILNSFNNGNPKGVPILSVCMATYKKMDILDEVLKSVKEKNILCPFTYEIIVVDDDPEGSSFEVCRDNKVYYALNANNKNSNPSIPRNLSFRMARGEVIVHQSDDVVHKTEDSLEILHHMTDVGKMVFANVLNVDMDSRETLETYTGPDRQKNFFFLGAILRSSLVKVGGYDENFISPAYDDDDLSDRLLRSGVSPEFTTDVVAHHLNHPKGSMSDGGESCSWYYQNFFSKMVDAA